MTIRITDRTTGESYLAKRVEDCWDLTDAIMYREVEAYGKTVDLGWAVAEIVPEGEVA